MSASDRIPVEPRVLAWARKTAGLDTRAAAKKMGTSEASLTRWESGDLAPTIKQLRKAAAAYHRPLAVLLLSTPPADFDAMRDFRRLDLWTGREWTPTLHAEYRRALSQREVLLELADLSPSSVPSSQQQLALRASEDPEAAGDGVRALLRLDEEPPTWSRAHSSLSACISALEDKGVLVVQTKGVETKEMRGFSVSEWPYPIIALNGSDSPRGRLFTLLHELAHLALTAGGLCDLHEGRAQQHRAEDTVEQFCNRVAAAALMPMGTFKADPLVSHASGDWPLDQLYALSRKYGPSSEAVLLRLVSLGLASWDLYWRRKEELEAEYSAARERERERRKESGGGPSFYVVKARDLGHGYVISVLDAFNAKVISSLDVVDYLDVRYDQLRGLEEAAV